MIILCSSFLSQYINNRSVIYRLLHSLSYLYVHNCYSKAWLVDRINLCNEFVRNVEHLPVAIYM